MLRTRPALLLLLLALLAPSLARAQRPAAERTGRPHYTLAMTINPRAGLLRGHMTVQWQNATGAPLPDVVLRLYPNFPRDFFGDGGDVSATVSNVKLNGATVTPRYEAQRTVVRLRFAAPLAVGAAFDIALDWEATVKPWRATDDTLPFPSYYPMLAAWTGAWRTDVTRFPDHVFAASATYQVSITAPTGLSVASSGAVTGTSAAGDLTTTEITTGPIREFAFAVGTFARAESALGNIAITVFHRTGDGLDAAAQRIADHAAASLAVYNERYGQYPYRTLQFHLVAASRGYDIGGEFPGLIYMLLNKSYTADTRFVVAHEVAHQWFYGQIGDDIFREPWLDEAFAQYSPLLVEERWAGAAAAEAVYQRHIAGLARRATLPAGLSLAQYGTWNTYYAAVYGKGAQFLRVLRETVGDDAFFAGMQRYVRTYQFGVARTGDFRRAMEAESGRQLGPLFRQWLGKE